ASPPRGESLVLELSEVAFDWLISESRNPAVQRLDPYRDTAFSGQSLKDLLDAVEHALELKTNGARDRVIATSKLPKDPAVRDRILSDLVGRALDTDQVTRSLRELCSFLELAAECAAIVHVDSD
ncbi:MAG TPA: hypothetical protein VFQ61_17920, partial [Polyangiaceae bacterium]|nr:hypothetical protein [Polyangiaceae bacterium]